MKSLLLFSVLILIAVSNTLHFASANPRMLALIKQTPIVLKYHGGELLQGKITVNLIWYGKFTRAQRSIIVDFLQSLNLRIPAPPSAASWWSTTARYKGGPRIISVGKQVFDQRYSVGKSLNDSQLVTLARKAGVRPSSVNVVLTSADVAVEDFCMNRCGTHGFKHFHRAHKTLVYTWVGNSAIQCPGLCAWPFHKPIVGPQTPALIPPNGDVGIDGMVINLATTLVNAVTNPSNKGYFQGPVTAKLEAVTACTGIFGSGAFPGYPGKVLVDRKTGASYNARGANWRKYMLPAMWNPTTFTCKTLL